MEPPERNRVENRYHLDVGSEEPHIYSLGEGRNEKAEIPPGWDDTFSSSSSVLQVPHSYRSIVACADDALPVGAESHLVHGSGMA